MYKFNGFTEKANRALNMAIESAGEMGHTADTSASKSGTVGGAHAAHLHTR